MYNPLMHNIQIGSWKWKVWLKCTWLKMGKKHILSCQFLETDHTSVCNEHFLYGEAFSSSGSKMFAPLSPFHFKKDQIFSTAFLPHAKRCKILNVSVAQLTYIDTLSYGWSNTKLWAYILAQLEIFWFVNTGIPYFLKTRRLYITRRAI